MVVLPKMDNSEFKLMIAKKGMSQRAFARQIGISHCYLSQLINGLRKPSPTTAGKIANGLRVEMEDIFFIQIGNKR